MKKIIIYKNKIKTWNEEITKEQSVHFFMSMYKLFQ